MQAKDSVAYWKNKVRSDPNSPYLYCRFTCRGKRRAFSLGTHDRPLAARLAKEIYLCVLIEGWEAALIKYRSQGPANDPIEPPPQITIGEWIEKARSRWTGHPKTFADYVQALHYVVSAIGLTNSDSMLLTDVSKARLSKWRSSCKTRDDRSRFNAYLRQASALFSKRLLKEFPEVQSPFEGVEKFPKSQCRSTRHYSRLPLSELVSKMRNEVSGAEWIVFVLAATCGLRPKEIDFLMRDAIDLEHGLIRVESNPWYELKTADAARDISMDPTVVEDLKLHLATVRGPFVIESNRSPEKYAMCADARCEKVFAQTRSALARCGVTAVRALQYCRGEYLSHMTKVRGVGVAQRAGGHSSPATTMAHYVDLDATPPSGLL